MKPSLILLLLLWATNTFGQTTTVQVNPDIVLPGDRIIRHNLLRDLNGFLQAASQPEDGNAWVVPEEAAETQLLLDELQGITQSRQFNEAHFYRPYLTNVVPLSFDRSLIQLSYIGVQDGQAWLQASVELIARMGADSSFLFAAPLRYHTQHWKTKTVGNNIFHYQDTINEAQVRVFCMMAASFDRKLPAGHKIVEYYCCDHLPELGALVGVSYKAAYNGRKESVWSTTDSTRKLIMLGNGSAHFDTFDPHDLWHDRLGLVISRRKVYKPADEACAYLYGGSWGISWNEILASFLEKVASDPQTDWKALKEKPLNFGPSAAQHLMADYVVTALIIQKLEKEKGFPAVWTLLNSGQGTPSHKAYYATLETLTGISPDNYNAAVWDLIRKLK